ncbi:DNA/RNA helicase [Halobacillus fulvus]|nr:DNA/RNA helicase [Halobacillus fulvus]
MFKKTEAFNWIPHHSTPHTFPHYAGKILLPHEIPPEHIEELTKTSVLTRVPSIIKKQCRRCGNQKPHLFGHLPHAKCQQDCLYCRNCIQMGRVIECEPLYIGSPECFWPAWENALAWAGELTPSQQQAADEIADLVKTGSGEKLVWAVCGAGKTEMLFPGIALGLAEGKRVCLATPRIDVVRELFPRLQRAFPAIEVQALHGESEKTGDGQLIIATTHQLLRFAHAFDVIVIDEVDAFPFHNDPSLHFAAKRAGKPDAARIYLTATPRNQEKRRIRSKQLPVVFIPKRFHGHPLPVPKLTLSFNLSRYLKKNELPAAILNLIKKPRDRQLLIFLSSISLTSGLRGFLASKGVVTEQVHAGDEDRKEKVERFRNKEIDILLTTTILERGVTFPSVDVFVIDAGHEVFDEAALVQIAGRAGRSPDDPKGDVIFFHSGKTNAMLDAYDLIRKMNRLGQKQ